MKSLFTLFILAAPFVASAQHSRAPIMTPQQQIRTYVAQPLQQGAQQTWNRYGAPAVDAGQRASQWGSGVSPAVRSFRYGTPLFIMVNPQPSGFAGDGRIH